MKKRFKEAQSRWFTPVQQLEIDACSRCQECIQICPVVKEGFPDGAMERIDAWQKLSGHLTGFFSGWRDRSKDHDLLKGISSTLARCTSCGLCGIVCESGISTASLWESMRGACMDLGFREPVAEKNAKSILEQKNPYEEAITTRTSWIPASAKIAENAEVCFFPGCTIAFRNQELGRAALRILNNANVTFCMLGDEEFCCGSFLFRTGFEEAYADTIRGMITALESKGVKTLLVSCAGCMKTIILDWPRIVGKPLPFRVMSFSSYIRDLIREQKIRLRYDHDIRVVYHDPCHSGRSLMHSLGKDTVFEVHRDVLTAIPGVTLIECADNREFSTCCGAGGGVKAEEPSLAQSIASRKLDEIDWLNPDILATTCPFCEKNLTDASRERGSVLKIMDVIELVDQTMEPNQDV